MAKIRSCQVLSLIASLFVFFLTSCNGIQSVDVGYVGSITGIYSPLLITSRNGALLAVEEMRESGVVDFNLVVRDNESNWKHMPEIINDFFDQNISLIFAAVTSRSWLAAQGAVSGRDGLFISPSVSSDTVYGIDDNFIRTALTSRQYGFRLGTHAAEVNGSRICFITDDNNRDYSDSLIKGFQEGFGPIDQAEFYRVGMPADTQRVYRTIAGKVRETNSDVIVFIMSPLDAAVLLQHLDEEKYLRLLSPWSVSPELVENGGESINGSRFFLPEGSPLSENPAYMNFSLRYTERFGEEPTYQALVSYDTMKILGEAVNRADSIDPADLKRYILDTRLFQGELLQYVIDDNGDCSYGLNAYKYENGEITPLNTTSP